MIYYNDTIKDIYLKNRKTGWIYYNGEWVYNGKEQYFTVVNSTDTLNHKINSTSVSSTVQPNVSTRIDVKCKLTTMSSMFSGCSSLISIDVSKLDTSNVTKMDNMFSDCSSLVSIDLSTIDTSKVTTISSMFKNCISLTSIDISNFNTEKFTGIGAFSGCTSLKSIKFGDFDLSNLTLIYNVFLDLSSLESFSFGKTKLGKKVTSFANLFKGCSSLKSVDLSGLEYTSKITVTLSMFSECSALEYINFGNFDPSKLNSFNGMFKNCSVLNHIRCTQTCKDWFLKYPSQLYLPAAMKEGGSGTWEIID